MSALCSDTSTPPQLSAPDLRCPQLSSALRLARHRSLRVPSVYNIQSRVEYSDLLAAGIFAEKVITSGQGQFGRQQRGGLLCRNVLLPLHHGRLQVLLAAGEQYLVSTRAR